MRYLGTAERFFLFGIKKVVSSSPIWSKYEILKKQFPSVSHDEFPLLEKDEYLFFQTQELRDSIYNEILKPNCHIKLQSPESARVFGTVLGYPPKAIEFFVSQPGEKKEDEKKKIGIRYCGVECAASLDDLVDDVSWLWEQYPYPDMDVLCVSYEREHVDFPYGDIEYVRRMQQKALNYIETGEWNQKT
jgi:hypothetical protein